MSDFGAIRSKLCRAPASSQVSMKKELLLPHILHCNFSHWCKHKRKLSSLKGWWGSVWSITMFSVLFCSTPSLTHTHTNCIAQPYMLTHCRSTPLFRNTHSAKSKSEKAQKEFTQDSHGAFTSYTTATPSVSASVSACVTHRRETTPHPTHAHITRHTTPTPQLHTHTHAHTQMEQSCHQGMPPRQCINPTLHQLGEPECRQDVKMWRRRQTETARESDKGRTGECKMFWHWCSSSLNESGSEVSGGHLSTVLAEDGRAERKVCVRHNEGKFNTAVPLNYYHLRVRNVNRNRCFSVGVSWFLVLLKYKNECDVKKISFPVCISLKL